RSMAKMMTLYAWPLPFNFALGTLAIVIYRARGPSYLVVLLAKVMILLITGSFIIAFLDVAHIMSTVQTRSLGLNTGIYTGHLIPFLLKQISNRLIAKRVLFVFISYYLLNPGLYLSAGDLFPILGLQSLTKKILELKYSKISLYILAIHYPGYG